MQSFPSAPTVRSPPAKDSGKRGSVPRTPGLPTTDRTPSVPCPQRNVRLISEPCALSFSPGAGWRPEDGTQPFHALLCPSPPEAVHGRHVPSRTESPLPVCMPSALPTTAGWFRPALVGRMASSEPPKSCEAQPPLLPLIPVHSVTFRVASRPATGQPHPPQPSQTPAGCSKLSPAS